MIPSSACRQFPHADQPGQAEYTWRPRLSYTTPRGTIQISTALEVTQGRIVAELAKIGFANMLDFIKVQDNGDVYVDSPLSLAIKPQPLRGDRRRLHGRPRRGCPSRSSA
jgi:hypothetical protein